MSERNSANGRMTTEYTVWCGKIDCAKWLQLASCANKNEAAKHAKQKRWEFTKEFGWRCPDCSQRARDAYAGR